MSFCLLVSSPIIRSVIIWDCSISIAAIIFDRIFLLRFKMPSAKAAAKKKAETKKNAALGVKKTTKTKKVSKKAEKKKNAKVSIGL